MKFPMIDHSFASRQHINQSSGNCIPIITIVTVVLNGKNFIESSLKSSLKQKYKNIELIIIDGGSKDGTLNVLRKFRQSIDKCLSSKDQGIYDAMNKGIKIARGDWVIFMNSDDVFYDKYVIRNVFQKFKRINNNVAIVYGDTEVFDNQTSKLVSISPHKALRELTYRLPIPHQSMFIRRSALLELGLFDIRYSIAADYDLTLKILSKYKVIYRKNIIIAKQRVGGVSSNPANLRKLLNENSMIRKKHGYSQFNINWTLSLFRANTRFFLVKIFGKDIK